MREEALKGLYNYIQKDKNGIYLFEKYLSLCALAGRVCYVHNIDFEDTRLNKEIIPYLDKLSKWTHYSVFAHLPVVVVVDETDYVEYKLYNLFKQYYNKDKELLYLNLRHILEAYRQEIGKGHLSYVLEDLQIDNSNIKGILDLIVEENVNINSDVIYFNIGVFDYFLIKNVDRALTHQLVRHQSLNFNQQSQRYVKMKNIQIPEIRMDVMSEFLENKSNKYEIMTEWIHCIRNSYECYKRLIEKGLPAEKARGVLPNDTPSNIVVSGFKKDIDKFIQDRTSKQAQSEIRVLANKMKEIKEV